MVDKFYWDEAGFGSIKYASSTPYQHRECIPPFQVWWPAQPYTKLLNSKPTSVGLDWDNSSKLSESSTIYIFQQRLIAEKEKINVQFLSDFFHCRQYTYKQKFWEKGTYII